ncbi:hypothetical protein WG66_012731, partial [Moniliophthora roreri]
ASKVRLRGCIQNSFPFPFPLPSCSQACTTASALFLLEGTTRVVTIGIEKKPYLLHAIDVTRL